MLFGLRLPQLVKIIPAQEIRHLIELAHRPGHGGHQCVHVQQATARGFDRAVINTKRPANLGDMYRPGLAGRDVEQDVLQVVLVIYLRVYGTAVFLAYLIRKAPVLKIWAMHSSGLIRPPAMPSHSPIMAQTRSARLLFLRTATAFSGQSVQLSSCLR